MIKHTPGPWKIDIGHQTKQARGISAATRNIVNFNGLASPASDESAANARLIATAPELLQMVIDLLDAGGDGDTDIENDARALIAKATGGEP